MIQLQDIDVVVVDIEGTTSASGYIFDVMFPYSRQEIPHWVELHRGSELLEDLKKQTAELLNSATLTDEEFVRTMQDWIDEDRKASPLKTAQGLIWEEGFDSGLLESHVFDEVPAALQTWKSQGLSLYVYSSGSVAAQISWFKYAPQGSLLEVFSGNFDTVNAGSKREATSYEVISKYISTQPHRTLFLSDVEAELIAAKSAGWQVVGVVREGEPVQEKQDEDIEWISAFDQLKIN
jgi:enolase-phosphatase E1